MKYIMKHNLLFIGTPVALKEDDFYNGTKALWHQAYPTQEAYVRQFRLNGSDYDFAIRENGIGEYAICFGRSDFMKYMIAGLYRGGDVPDKMIVVPVPAFSFAVIEKEAHFDSLRESLYNEAKEFLLSEEMKDKQKPKFIIEHFGSNTRCEKGLRGELWIPIEPLIK